MRTLLATLLAGAGVSLAARKQFRVQDDILAFPQFGILFPEEYVFESDAKLRLKRVISPSFQDPKSASAAAGNNNLELLRQSRGQDEGLGSKDGISKKTEDTIESYQEMVFGSQKFLCDVPKVESAPTEDDSTFASGNSPEQEEKELARATNRGLELLQDMKNCLYYSAGWWSYSFCYMNQVRQFHALIPGNGVPSYPPAEDPNAQTYVLGQFNKSRSKAGKALSTEERTVPADVSALQTKGESRYLVQYLENGTVCTLGKKRWKKQRKIEVQYHCHPQSTDHIAWIKEISTCSYVMLIYTPRLCNDVAFQPPTKVQPNGITCREIISPDRVPEWQAAKASQAERELRRGGRKAYTIIGDIEVGAMKLVGKGEKRIERGRVASAGEERIEVVAKSRGGDLRVLSKEELKRFNLDPDKIEALKKRLEDVTGGRDWHLEVVDADGHREIRGIVDTYDEADDVRFDDSSHRTRSDEKQDEKGRKDESDLAAEDSDSELSDEGDFDTGSHEAYKEEL